MAATHVPSEREISKQDNEEETASLQITLRNSTRDVHMRLNRAIISRLPLCLPPNTQSPTAYYLGIMAIGNIYKNFEQATQELLQQPQAGTETEASNAPTRAEQIVAKQNVEGLLRHHKLQRDLDMLSWRLKHHTSTCKQADLLGDVVTRLLTRSNELCAHIIPNLKERPHLVLAYTWTMYLALFNGGRWLRRELASAGPEFWLESNDGGSKNVKMASAESLANNSTVLSFWKFDEASAEDPQAEKLKLDFKQKFDQASEMLMPGEREEIAKEAISVFELCTRLIHLLDDTLSDMNSAPTPNNIVDATDDKQQNSITTKLWCTLDSLLRTMTYNPIKMVWPKPIGAELKATET